MCGHEGAVRERVDSDPTRSATSPLDAMDRSFSPARVLLTDQATQRYPLSDILLNSTGCVSVSNKAIETPCSGIPKKLARKKPDILNHVATTACK